LLHPGGSHYYGGNTNRSLSRDEVSRNSSKEAQQRSSYLQSLVQRSTWGLWKAKDCALDRLKCRTVGVSEFLQIGFRRRCQEDISVSFNLHNHWIRGRSDVILGRVPKQVTLLRNWRLHNRLNMVNDKAWNTGWIFINNFTLLFNLFWFGL